MSQRKGPKRRWREATADQYENEPKHTRRMFLDVTGTPVYLVVVRPRARKGKPR